jgi:hypothetical protein
MEMENILSRNRETMDFKAGALQIAWRSLETTRNRGLKYPDKELIPYDAPNALKDIQGTLMYKANQQFIQRALQEGTILDIGKTYDSHFYDMEILNVFN